MVLAGCSGAPEQQLTGSDEDQSIELPQDNVVSEPSAPQPVSINVGDGVLTSPNDFQVAVLFYKIVGLEPPFDKWAKSDRRTEVVNEFDREEVASRIQQELLLAASSVADIGYIEINTDSRFGEYDMPSQGFRLEVFDPDRFWHWSYGGDQYILTMNNANAVDLWKINPDDARKIVESGRGRNVDLKIKIKIVGAVPQPNGGGVLQGNIVSYQVFTGDGRKIGEMNY
jgi:hypothetical protein